MLRPSAPPGRFDTRAGGRPPREREPVTRGAQPTESVNRLDRVCVVDRIGVHGFSEVLVDHEVEVLWRGRAASGEQIPDVRVEVHVPGHLLRTAQQMGFKDLVDPETGIHAGIRYLSWVRDRFEADLPAGQRIWFALAAYNAGAGHVRDARKLARARGLDPDRWFENVEEAMLLKQRPEIHATTRFGYCNGEEPVRYVRAISERYDAYAV